MTGPGVAALPVGEADHERRQRREAEHPGRDPGRPSTPIGSVTRREGASRAMTSTNGRKSLVIYLVCEPETPDSRRPRSRAAPTSSSSGSRSRTRSRRGRRSGSRPSGRSRAGCGRRSASSASPTSGDRVDVPLVPMTYAAILEAYGYERFVADSRAAGATTAIVVDLPVEEHPEVPRIQLVAPTSTDERIALCAGSTDGWLYLVSLTGTTGARDEVSPALAGLVERTRAADGRAALRRASASRRPAHAAAVAGAGGRRRRRLARGAGRRGRARRAARLRPQPARRDRRRRRDDVGGRRRRRRLRRLDRPRARSARLGRDARRAVHARPRALRLGRRHAAAPLLARRGRVVHAARAARARALARARGREPARACSSRSGVAWFDTGDERLHAAQRGDAAPARHPVRAADAGGGAAASTRRSAATTSAPSSSSPTPACSTRGARRRRSRAACRVETRPRDAGRPAARRRRRLGLRRVAAGPLPRRSSSQRISRRDVFFVGVDGGVGRHARLLRLRRRRSTATASSAGSG